MAMWRNGGSLPNDDAMLARYAKLTPGRWAKIKPIIWRFFTISENEITQSRLTDEYELVKQKSRKQKNNIRSRWLKNNNSKHTTVLPEDGFGNTPTTTSTATSTNISSGEDILPPIAPQGALFDSEPPPLGKRRPYSAEFEKFWEKYPEKAGSKFKASEIYGKLIKKGFSHDEIQRGAEAYADHVRRTGEQFVAHATTWLNGRRWETAPDPAGAGAGEPASERRGAGRGTGNGRHADGDPWIEEGKRLIAERRAQRERKQQDEAPYDGKTIDGEFSAI